MQVKPNIAPPSEADAPLMVQQGNRVQAAQPLGSLVFTVTERQQAASASAFADSSQDNGSSNSSSSSDSSSAGPARTGPASPEGNAGKPGKQKIQWREWTAAEKQAAVHRAQGSRSTDAGSAGKLAGTGSAAYYSLRRYGTLLPGIGETHAPRVRSSSDVPHMYNWQVDKNTWSNESANNQLQCQHTDQQKHRCRTSWQARRYWLRCMLQALYIAVLHAAVRLVRS